MVRPQRSKAEGLFDNLEAISQSFSEFEFNRVLSDIGGQAISKEIISTPEVKVDSRAIKKKNNEVSGAKKEFLKRLEEELFNDFTKKDWLMYWQYKASNFGVKYIVANYAKEYAILNGLMNRFSAKEIKLMIDFLWDCDHDLQNRSTMGTWMLSKGWINSVYQSALLWEKGEYKTLAQKRDSNYPQRNREWLESDSQEHKNKIRI